MRSLFFCVSFLAFSCRELTPLDYSVPVTGYQFNGTVMTVNGIPMDSVALILYYYYDYVADFPSDTVQVIVRDTAQVLEVAVCGRDSGFLETIYRGHPARVGPVARYSWDGTGPGGVQAPSGLYFLRYSLDSAVIKYSPVLLDGNASATTDMRGDFILTDYMLPVGATFDAYSSDGKFYGRMAVLPEIGLGFTKESLTAEYSSIGLDKDKITHGAFTL